MSYGRCGSTTPSADAPGNQPYTALRGMSFATLRNRVSKFNSTVEHVMANPIAEKMSEASNKVPTNTPQMGQQFKCPKCGMRIEVVVGCNCKEAEHSHFECCGQEMSRQ